MSGHSKRRNASNFSGAPRLSSWIGLLDLLHCLQILIIACSNFRQGCSPKNSTHQRPWQGKPTLILELTRWIHFDTFCFPQVSILKMWRLLRKIPTLKSIPVVSSSSVSCTGPQLTYPSIGTFNGPMCLRFFQQTFGVHQSFTNRLSSGDWL